MSDLRLEIRTDVLPFASWYLHGTICVVSLPSLVNLIFFSLAICSTALSLITLLRGFC